MRAFAALAAFAAIVAVLWEAFETVILPRRIYRKLRLTRFFYLFTWSPWRRAGSLIKDIQLRESVLSVYGPLSLVVLFASWGTLLVVAFGFLQWGLGSGLRNSSGAPITLGTDIYMSGTTLFTLGLGDITPQTTGARTVAIAESAIGFGLIAMVISYLPTLYQAFARREVNISLLAARAGSPPTAAEFFDRLDGGSSVAYLSVCEQWAAEVWESQISYPVLCFFRSQHANQSWLTALTAILDICVSVQVNGDPEHRRQAALTFSMARHALLDIAKVFRLDTGSKTNYRDYAEALAKLIAVELPSQHLQ